MKNLLPQFIAEKYEKGRSKGSLKAASLFLDITGFTGITEKLMRKDKEGAEILSGILNSVFDPLIEIIYANKGFVSGFAGDAFTAIFRGKEAVQNICNSAFNIIASFNENKIYSTKFGLFSLSVKLGLSFGNIEWGIAGSGNTKAYYFRGEAIDGSAKAEHLCRDNQIIADANLFSKISNKSTKFTEIKPGYYRLEPSDYSIRESKPEKFPIPINVLEAFFPDIIVHQPQDGEFREIISIFISFEESRSFSALNAFITRLMAYVQLYGGYFNHLDFGDKNANMLVFFGAPVSYSNNIKRAFRFIDSIKKEFGNKIKAGVTNGTVYAGELGSKLRSAYTCLGDIVNISARLVNLAKFGDIIISESIMNQVSLSYNFKSLRKRRLKGKRAAVQVYRLSGKKGDYMDKEYSYEFIGRKHELDKIKNISKSIFENRFAGIISIYGEAGIGKSRLVDESLKDIKKQGIINLAILQTDEFVRKSLSPFVYYFSNYFDQHKKTSLEDKRNAFEAIYSELVNKLDRIAPGNKQISELIRIKSVIASLIGLKLKDSILESISPKDIPNVTRFAVKEFFKALSCIHPLVIVVEDIHFLDKDSQGVFKVLTRMIWDFPIIIFATGRSEGNIKPILSSDKDIPRLEIDLSRLKRKETGYYVQEILKKKVDDRLFRFILEKTEGNPFYIDQFCFYLQENGLLDFSAGNISLKKKAVSHIPSKINAILISRIDRLSKDLKDTIQIAAVLGREFEIILLLELIRILTAKRALQASVRQENLGIILEKGKMERVWDALSELKYIFKHALLHEAVYEMQLKSRLRKLHELAAVSLENISSNDPTKYPEIAFHYEQSEKMEMAKKYCLLSGKESMKNYENESAIVFFNKALLLQKRINPGDISPVWEIEHSLIKAFLNKHLPEQALLKLNKFSRFFRNIPQNIQVEITTDYADSYISIGNFDAALNAVNSYISKIKSNAVHSRPYREALLLKKSDILYNKGNYSQSLEITKSILDDKLGSLPGESLEIGKLYLIIGQNLFKLTQLIECRNYMEKALDIYTKTLGRDHPDTANVIKSLGNVENMMGNYQSALDLYNQAFDIWKKTYGEKHTFMAALLESMSVNYFFLGDLNKHYKYSKKAHDINIEILGQRHWQTTGSYHSFGSANFYIGNFAKAWELYNTELEIYREHHPDGHPDESKILTNLGLVAMNTGELKQSLKLFEQSRKIILKYWGERHLDLFSNYYSTGNVYMNMKKYDEAEEYLKKAARIQKKCLGSRKHKETAMVYNNIGVIYNHRKDYKRSIKYFKKAYNIFVSLFGKIHQFNSFPLNGIAEAYNGLRQPEKALPYLQESLDIQLKTIGEDNQNTAYTYYYLGRTYLLLKNEALTEKHFNRAISIRKRLWPEGNPLLVNNIFDHAKAYKSFHKFAKALETAKYARNEAEKLKDKAYLRSINGFISRLEAKHS